MRIEAILVVIAEWVACIAWIVQYKKFTAKQYNALPIYLSIIAVTELANLLFRESDTSITNLIVIHFNVPLEILFWLFFLLYPIHNKFTKRLLLCFMIIYLTAFFVERNSFITNPKYFDSLSYSIGNLFLMAAIMISIFHFFKKGEVLNFNKTAFFWIILGLLIYYVGSFPYQNFRNFFWSNTNYYSTAYKLHYLSQSFNTIMYLLFAYAAKWKVQ